MRSGSSRFSGYFFLMPDELDPLMDLTRAQLRVHLVLTRAIQRDRNRGLLSIRQVRDRAHLSYRHAQAAVDVVCSLEFFTRHDPKTGVRLTSPEQWRSRPIEYRENIKWKRKNAPTSLSARDPDHQPAAVEYDGDQHPVPTGNQHRFPPGDQHLESLEPLAGC